ncbi:glycosyltransferase [Albimonas sp. CAU 1670]|uniref:glycosyltransferase n=1 Tax=Albimonas sp. CAU 1670 TaxID=3032599 RepID=UPI0023D9A655|nr:glycosyltransferase [Albimonas sp. CAU 1670]MDF2234819.1 glycosyltransferase [Albimonas sp. CAU 1670]
MTGRVHVAVIYTDAGGGHRASAHALKACLEATGRYRVTLVNPYKALIPHLDVFARLGRRSGEEIYNESILRRGRGGLACWLFYAGLKLNYVAFEAPATRILARYFEEEAPDVALSVMPLSNRVMLNALARYRASGPQARAAEGVVLITDWAELAPGLWFPDRDDYHAICGTPEAAAHARRRRRLAPRVREMGGLLVRPEVAEAARRPARREALGLAPARPVVTVLYGAHGSDRMVDLAQEMRRVPHEAQVVFLCGWNEAVAERLRALDAPFPRQVIGFTDRVPDYLSVSDLFIGKPGPGSVSEALALGAPLLLDRSLALPQEGAVLRHVLRNDLGAAFGSLDEFRRRYANALSGWSGARPRRRAPNTSNADVVAILDEISAGCRPASAETPARAPDPAMGLG